MDLLTVQEAASLLRLSRGAVYVLCSSGRLPHYRVGVGRGAIRISDGDLATFIEQCRQEPPDRAAAAAPSSPGPAPRQRWPHAGGFKHLRLRPVARRSLPPPEEGQSSDRGGRNAR
ncbi:MAG: helix-turn-helix domain-containing protein [Planctomycetes bacterium]|nr:helix-turn-helix domain-containing protein [Planctomycetia bacterium]MBI3466400.1 helix-turn-helix domain-containing protein [Planctomycetota bacterium]